MEFKYHVLALGGGILLGVIAGFVAKSLLVAIVLPVGIYVCAMLWGKVSSIQKEEMENNPQLTEKTDGEITQEAVSDKSVPPVQK